MAHDNRTATSRLPTWAWLCVGTSPIAAVAALATAFPSNLLAAFVGWVLGVAAAVCAVKAVVRHRRRLASVAARPHVRNAWVLLVISIVFVVTQSMLVIAAGRAFRDDIRTSFISAGHLKMIQVCIQEYVDKHKAWPDTMQDLLALENSRPAWFVDPFDPGVPKVLVANGKLLYSSYVLKPARPKAWGDPLIVVAYAREPWALCGTHILSQKRGRCVLFADFNVTVLGEPAFEEAIARDNARRKELGWPTDVVYTPSTLPASQPTSAPGTMPPVTGG